MKNVLKIQVLPLLFLIGLGFQSCEDRCVRTYTYVDYEPIIITQAELDAAITSSSPQELESPGKIYSYGNYLFINEQQKGVHIVDNSDPSQPSFVSFVTIPGNVDMAVKGDILFADTYTDLLAIDISNPLAVSLKKRVENIKDSNFEMYPNEDGTYTIGWNPVEKTIETDCQQEHVDYDEWLSSIKENDMSIGGGFGGGSGQQNEVAAPSNGVGGSMARFTIVGDMLYTINNSELNAIDISQTDNPSLENTVGIGWNIETIYPSMGYLFIGSATGMFVYDMATPSAPSYVSSLDHEWACDPVYIYENYALVTLRSADDSWCNNVDNQLDIIDISDIHNPTLLQTFPMDNPHGMSIDKDHLFLCEGESGLKVFDLSALKNGLHPSEYDIEGQMTDHETDLHAFDAIALPGASDVMMVIGEDGLYQYDYTNFSDLEILSIIQSH